MSRIRGLLLLDFIHVKKEAVFVGSIQGQLFNHTSRFPEVY